MGLNVNYEIEQSDDPLNRILGRNQEQVRGVSQSPTSLINILGDQKV